MPQVIQPRGLRRMAAATYLGISPSHFDKERAAGTIPAPKNLFGVVLYDRYDLDACFDGKAVQVGMLADNDNEEWWDSACATGSQNTSTNISTGMAGRASI